MPRKILVVDDAVMNRMLLKNALHREYDIVEAENGAEALEIMRRQHRVLSAVLLDIMMPVMDGYEVLRRMRDNPALAQIPVIMVTGTDDEDARVRALSLGANDFIAKPYNPDIIRHCLRNNIALRETASIVNAIQRDKLTGLYNREFFFEKAEEMIRDAEPGAYMLACYDIDNFKLVNDQLGAAAGDRILRSIGAAVKQFLEEAGGVGGRISGDNFALLYPNRPDVLDTLTTCHLERRFLGDQGLNLQYSIGRYAVIDRSLPVSAIYDRAYIAKQSVKGRYDEHIAYFSESMLDKLLSEQQIVLEMGEALASRQFETWFQPQYNHETGALIGAEALVRWRHPERGMVSPGVFIPVFEQNGFIYALDKFVWEDACRTLRKWLDEGRNPLPISVNISRYDVFRDDFYTTITGLLRRYDLPVDLLRLEVTESAFAKAGEQIITVVKSLIDFGFTVEIDDFGSGYSSLNTLKDVPAQVLKLDMKFLESSEDSERGGNILESIVRMTRWLGMSVIAEGVETKKQADYLKSIGCFYVQGYLYARPMPVAAYEALCRGIGKEERLIALETVENLNNDAFWNPNSMDTLIFNSYVGGACIFEWSGGKEELLRANRKYAESFGAHVSNEDVYARGLADFLDDENQAKLRESTKRAIATGEEIPCEVVAVRLFGSQAPVYIRMAVRAIARAETRYLLYRTVENVTAQREAEIKARRSATMLQTILNGMNGGISVATYDDDFQIHIIFANDKFYAMLGYTRAQAEAESLDVLQLIYPDDRPVARAAIERLFADRQPCEYEYRCYTRDRRVIYLRCNKSLASIEGYGDQVVITAITDITALVGAERRATKLAEELQAIMGNVNGGVTATLILGADTRLLYYNDTYAAQLGYTRAEFEAKQPNLFGMLHPDDRARVIDEANRGSLARGRYSCTYRIVRKDGEVRFMRSNISVITLPDTGDAPVQLAVANDITEQIEADRASRRLSDQLQAILDNAGQGITASVLHKQSIDILFANEKYYALLGYTRAQYEAEVSDPMTTIDPADRPRAAIIVRGKSAASLECRALRRDGGKPWLRIAISTARITGIDDPVQLAFFTDITREKEAEMEVAKTAAKLARAEEKQRELLDNLPHGAALYEYDGRTLSVVHRNKRYLEMTGHPSAAHLQTDVSYIIHPHDRDIVMRELNAAVAQARDAVCDFRLICADGAYRPFHVVGRIVQKRGARFSVYASFTPISNGEMTLRESLPIVLSAIMEFSTDLTFAKDKDFKYICASRTFATMVGLDDERNIIGKTDYDIYPAGFADKFRGDDEAMFRDGQPRVDMIEAIPSPDGKPHYASTSKFLLRDTRGNIIGLYGLGRDITKALETDSQLKLLTDNIPGGIATLEIAPGEPDSMRLTYFSDGFARVFGYSHADFEERLAADPFACIDAEDLPKVKARLQACVATCQPLNFTYRAHRGDGALIWVNLRGALDARAGARLTVNAVLLDVTEQQQAIEQLRISEEENRLAMRHVGNVVCRFSVSDRSLTVTPEIARRYARPERIENLPYDKGNLARISPESQRAYIEFYEDILRGGKSGTVVFQTQATDGWRWLEAHYSTIFSSDGKPLSAVVSYTDVTDRLEKEAVYTKWRQSMIERAPDSYTLFRYIINRKLPLDNQEGALLSASFKSGAYSFDERTHEYADQYVHPDDRARYIGFLKADDLLANYYLGKRRDVLEYRELCQGGGVRWLRLTVELVEYPNSSEVEAYLMFENIDEHKRATLQIIERAETDPLTGVLNRATFSAKVEQALRASEPDAQHALLMLDIDGFKAVNDVLGHGAGDQALVDVASAMRGMLRHDDLVGRLGGDEFLIFLRNIPNNHIAAVKAEQLCAQTCKALSPEVRISSSIGIAITPADGLDFQTLYQKADAALYHIKNRSKNGYAFYESDMTASDAVAQA